MKVSVIVLNWNGKKLLQRYLPALLETEYKNVDFIVADNASEDGSAEWVHQTFPMVKVVQLDQNYGYCGGNNRAALHADGDILVFLNNDVRVHSEWLKHITDGFARYPDTAAMQPKMLSELSPVRFDYAGAAGGMIDKLGYPWCYGRIADTTEIDRGQYDDSDKEIFWASGAAFCVRSEVFKKANGFDESFGFHMEEIDLCWRFQRMGWKIRVMPKAIVYHLGGGSLSYTDPRKTFYNFRNNLAMLAKNVKQSALFPVLMVRVFLDFLAFIKLLIDNDRKTAWSVPRAYTAFYKELPYWLKIRGELLNKLQDTKTNKNKSDENMLAVKPNPFSIFFNHYVLKQKTSDNQQ
ncbi:MAG: glycosyltransferase family 2 protein [Balneolales bacterium]|nr:glycosyltransferase family 2 protein [Balneolales bacterium]